MPSKNLTPRPVSLPRRALTSAEFSQLEDVPPETEWFANIDNPNTRRAYRNDLKEFMTFAGIRTPIELRLITRAHVIAWRKDLDHSKLAPGSMTCLSLLCGMLIKSYPTSNDEMHLVLHESTYEVHIAR
jgi:hypothetical protein